MFQISIFFYCFTEDTSNTRYVPPASLARPPIPATLEPTAAQRQQVLDSRRKSSKASNLNESDNAGWSQLPTLAELNIDDLQTAVEARNPDQQANKRESKSKSSKNTPKSPKNAPKSPKKPLLKPNVPPLPPAQKAVSVTPPQTEKRPQIVGECVVIVLFP